MQLKIGDRYQHYKKKTVYTIVGDAHHTETGERMVLYRPDITPSDLLERYPDGVTFTRPYEMFIESVQHEGQTVKRFELVEQKTESVFVPKTGQADFTNVRWCPVVNCVVTNADKILLVKRSQGMRLYPGCWNGISGFLDDSKNLEEKVREELHEELGLKDSDISKIELKAILKQEDKSINKTWLVHAVRVEILTQEVTLDWEAETYKWYKKEDLADLNFLPGFEEVIEKTT